MRKNTLIFSKGISNLPFLPQFLPEHQIQTVSFWHCLNPWYNPKADCVVGWGLRPTTKKARAYAQKHGLPYIALEDGFLRSIGLGVLGYPTFSLVVDDVGIYYDTTRPSRLENLILACELSENERTQAEKAMALIRKYRLSKYNHAPDFSPEEMPTDKPIVLVVDQTFGDMAVKYGQADERDFQRMLDCAIAENPDAEIWVKTHPDVISGKKRGYLTALADYLANYPDRIRLFSQDVGTISLLQAVEKVYCVTSQMGFEALLLNKPVTTFGVPWFAGWGLTDDRHSKVAELHSRRKVRSIFALFYAAYFQYSRYINPNTGKQGTVFDVVEYLRLGKGKPV